MDLGDVAPGEGGVAGRIFSPTDSDAKEVSIFVADSMHSRIDFGVDILLRAKDAALTGDTGRFLKDISDLAFFGILNLAMLSVEFRLESENSNRGRDSHDPVCLSAESGCLGRGSGDPRLVIIFLSGPTDQKQKRSANATGPNARTQTACFECVRVCVCVA